MLGWCGSGCYGDTSRQILPAFACIDMTREAVKCFFAIDVSWRTSMQARSSHNRLLPGSLPPRQPRERYHRRETFRSKCSLGDLCTFVTGKSYKNAQATPGYTADCPSLLCALRTCALEDIGKDVSLPVFDQPPCPCPSAWPCGALLPAGSPWLLRRTCCGPEGKNGSRRGIEYGSAA